MRGVGLSPCALDGERWRQDLLPVQPAKERERRSFWKRDGTLAWASTPCGAESSWGARGHAPWCQHPGTQRTVGGSAPDFSALLNMSPSLQSALPSSCTHVKEQTLAAPTFTDTKQCGYQITNSRLREAPRTSDEMSLASTGPGVEAREARIRTLS